MKMFCLEMLSNKINGVDRRSSYFLPDLSLDDPKFVNKCMNSGWWWQFNFRVEIMDSYNTDYYDVAYPGLILQVIDVNYIRVLSWRVQDLFLVRTHLDRARTKFDQIFFSHKIFFLLSKTTYFVKFCNCMLAKYGKQERNFAPEQKPWRQIVEDDLTQNVVLEYDVSSQNYKYVFRGW